MEDMALATHSTSLLKIVLIEDSLPLRQTLASVLSALSGVEVVGDAADERAAIDLIERRQPDLAIVDLQLKAGSGIGVLKALSATPGRFGRPRAVVFSDYGQSVARARCFALGVEGFFDKATGMDALLAYVRGSVRPAPS